MTNQPKTEDGNELSNIYWKSGIFEIISHDQMCKLSKLINGYIQSNYILKSDVEKIITPNDPTSDGGGLCSNGLLLGRVIIDHRNALRREQRIKASQYGLTKSDIIE
jgi:hypothetical protein